jgi:hypothetical protein
MKLVIRAFALCLVLAGATAATLSSSTSQSVPSHQSATAALPIPACGPWVPCQPSAAPKGLK